MLVRLQYRAALCLSAALVFCPGVFAQAPIVDASVEADESGRSSNSRSSTAPRAGQGDNTGSGSGQGELFYQLQLLQQEVMQLRGQVEEQAYQIKQLKEQNMERYIDLDRRIGRLSAGGAVSPQSDPDVSDSAAAMSEGSSAEAQPGEKEAYDNAYGLVIEKRFDEALEAFKQFLTDYPNGKYAPNSYYWIGELYQVITPAKLDAAREAFRQLLNQYPDHSKVPDAMYKLGKVYFLQGDRQSSRQWLEKVIAEHSSGTNSSAADKARQFLNTHF